MTTSPEHNEDGRDLLEAIAGLRAGSPAEQALRRELLTYSEVIDQAPGTEIRLSPAELEQRERTRRKLEQRKLLPRMSAADAVQPATRPNWLERIGQLLAPGGRVSWGWPAGAAAALAVMLATAVLVLQPRDKDPGSLQAAGNGSAPTVLVPNSGAYCNNLSAELQAGLPGVQVVTNTRGEGCTLQVATKDPEVQAAAQKIFEAAGAKVLVSPNMEILVQEAK